MYSFENLDVSSQSAEMDSAMLDVIFAFLRALLSGFQPVRGEFPSGVAAAVLALEDDAAQPV